MTFLASTEADTCANALPIIGSGKVERVKSAIAAEKLRLNREQWYSIREASTGYSVP